VIRRNFLKIASTAVGAVTLAPWVIEREAAEAADVDAGKSAFAEAALTRAKVLGASYADIRINRYRSETIFTRERQVQNVARNQDFGFGIRVLVNGTWGFAASALVTADESVASPPWPWILRAPIRGSSESGSGSRRSNPPWRAGRVRSRRIRSTCRSTTRFSSCWRSTTPR
jgi:hypothetical protein